MAIMENHLGPQDDPGTIETMLYIALAKVSSECMGV